MTNAEKLVALYGRKAADGLLDVKFLVRGLEEAATEEICQDVVNLHQAVADGKVKPLDFGDLRWNEVDKP